MGGFGALSLGFTHPDIFQMIGAHSPSLRTWSEAPDVLGNRDEYAAIDPVELAPTLDPKNEPAIWLDVGRRDDWAERVRGFHDQLRDLKIAHKFQEKVGEHDSDYWAKQIPQYLKFYAGMPTSE
jgi:enterochelin esterase-like enzyme